MAVPIDIDVDWNTMETPVCRGRSSTRQSIRATSSLARSSSLAGARLSLWPRWSTSTRTVLFISAT